MFGNLASKLGLYPRKLEGRFHNERALLSAFARQANMHLAPYKDLDGSVRIKDPFGYGFAGYAVPLPDELKQKAGTIYPQGMQLITQPLWHTQTYTDNSTTSLSFFNAVTSGITGNMELAGAISFPKSFIIRAVRYVPQVSNSFQATAAVVAVWNDLSLLSFNSYHTLRVLDKEYLRVPSIMLPSGTGLGNNAAAGTFTAPAVVGAGNWGIADPRATYILLDPLWLETQVAFTYTQTWSAAQDISGNQSITIVFDGQFVRPVQ